MYERQTMNVIEKSIIGKKCQEACEDGLDVMPWCSSLNISYKNWKRMPWRMISAKASCIYICDKVYKPLGVAERLLQHPEERHTASAVIYSRSRQEMRMVGDGGAWTEAQRPYLNHATLLVFILCLSFKARY